MVKTVTKHLLTIEVLNILSWIEKEESFISSIKLPIEVQWEMHKNLLALDSIRKTYADFDKRIQEQYSDDKYSTESVNENQQPIRMVKKEYLKEYNQKRNELLLTENDIVIKQFNIDVFSGTDISLSDMAMLNIFIVNE